MSGIDKIEVSLMELLAEKEIIARCELLNRTYDAVRKANLADSEREELERMVGKHIAAGIFASMMSSEPIFFGFQAYTYAQINGRIFHSAYPK
jgi:hypothetical protein